MRIQLKTPSGREEPYGIETATDVLLWNILQELKIIEESLKKEQQEQVEVQQKQKKSRRE